MAPWYLTKNFLIYYLASILLSFASFVTLDGIPYSLAALLIASNTSPTWATNAKASVSSCDDADSSGVYELILPRIGVKSVFCDVTDDGGKWTVFQRRKNGNVDFYRGWDDYVNGFGDLQGDHWLGLEAIFWLTRDWDMELEIKMITNAGVYSVAKWSTFLITPGFDNYRLHAYGHSGNATWSGLAFHTGQPFSTYDADHDAWSEGNCASDFEGAWWYWGCAFSNLNGNFNKEGHDGIWWDHPSNQLRFSEMRIRKIAWD